MASNDDISGALVKGHNIKALWDSIWNSTMLKKLRKAMGLGDTLGALPIANGGTGETSLYAAQRKLCWVPCTCTITKSTTSAYCTVKITAPNSTYLKNWSYIRGTIVFNSTSSSSNSTFGDYSMIEVFPLAIAELAATSWNGSTSQQMPIGIKIGHSANQGQTVTSNTLPYTATISSLSSVAASKTWTIDILYSQAAYGSAKYNPFISAYFEVLA